MGSVDVLVLLSGPVAAGKTSVRQALMSSYGFDYVRSSTYLKSLAEMQGLGMGRTSLQDLGDELDRQTDYRWVLDKVALPSISASPERRRWLVDAVRKRRQVEHFRNAFGASVLHVQLTASEDVLRERYAVRLAITDDTTPYEVAITHENEVASRELIAIAELVLDTGTLSPEEAAEQISSVARTGSRR